MLNITSDISNLKICSGQDCGWLPCSVAFGKLLVNEFRSCFKGYFHGKQNKVRSEQFSTSVIGCVLSAEAMTCNRNANILPGQSKVDMAEQEISCR